MNADQHWVFAYGSNMNLQDLRRWFARGSYSAPCIERVERATLHDHRLVWNYYSSSRKAGAANVERAPGYSLPGIALLVDEDTLKAIDSKEGHPSYYSRGMATVPVQLQDGIEVAAWLYVAVPARCTNTTQPPTSAYLDLLIHAAEEHELPNEHIALLKATPTAEGINE